MNVITSYARERSITDHKGRSISYEYDDAGNRTILDEAGAKTEYLYNKANQLMRTDTPHGTTIFEYDKRGNVIHKHTEGTQHRVSVSYTYGAKTGSYRQ